MPGGGYSLSMKMKSKILIALGAFLVPSVAWAATNLSDCWCPFCCG
jgi:hypothetical protein